MKYKNAKHLYKIVLFLILFPLVPFRIDEQNTLNDAQTIVAITIDDSHSSWIETVDPILKKHNISITGFINDVDILGDLSWDEIETLSKTGRWEFGWHGTNHYLLTKLTHDEEEAQISGFNGLFENHSLPTPKSFAYPYGGYDYSTMSTVSTYFSASRTVNEGINSVYWVTEKPMQIKVIRIFEERDNDYYMDIVSENLDTGVFIVFYHHAVEQTIGAISDSYEISKENYESLIKWLTEQDIEIMTFSDGITEMRTRQYQMKVTLKLDNPFENQFTSIIPIPSRYWEIMFISANIIGQHNAVLGDLILKYITQITTFIVLSLIYCLFISLNLIKKSDRA